MLSGNMFNTKLSDTGQSNMSLMYTALKAKDHPNIVLETFLICKIYFKRTIFVIFLYTLMSLILLILLIHQNII